MKKKLLVSMPIYMTISGSTFAQSSVVLSGLLGTGIGYSTDAGKGGSLYQMTGSHTVPFWAISGRETLDTDTSAFFRLSQYAFLNNGTGTPFESYVGLKSTGLGTLTLGSMYDLLADLAPFTSERYTSFLATHPGNLDRTVGNSLNNLIKYKSPVFAGALQFGALCGFGQQGSTTNTGRTTGLEASYSAGPILSVLVWESVNGAPYAPYTRLGVGELHGIDFSANHALTVSQNQNTTTVGVAYAGDTTSASYTPRLCPFEAYQPLRARSAASGGERPTGRASKSGASDDVPTAGARSGDNASVLNRRRLITSSGAFANEVPAGAVLRDRSTGFRIRVHQVDGEIRCSGM